MEYNGVNTGKIDKQINVKTTFNALWLVREGDHVVLKMETAKGKWVTLISEYIDAPFSHIIESEGIKSKLHETDFQEKDF